MCLLSPLLNILCARLTSTYREYATEVKSTGRGVQETENTDTNDATGWIATIPRTGPDADTPPQAKNIWRE